MAALPLILMVAGSVLSAKSQADQGAAANAMAKSEADQMGANALSSQAAAQRTALGERKQAGYAESRVQALAAGSGAGATDPTVLNIEGDIHKQGEFNALNALYNGDSRASQLNAGADIQRLTGQSAQKAGNIGALSTVLSTGSSLYSRFGSTPPGGTATTTATYRDKAGVYR